MPYLSFRTWIRIESLLDLGPDENGMDLQPGFLDSVPDPWHFGVDPDPDPRIHASD